MKNTILNGHIAAIMTIFIWGTTFVSTKVLFNALSPVEILITRFLIAYITLWIVHPYITKPLSKKQEFLLALAGLCGITLYYLLENIALTYTLASNVGVIMSISPFFTAILSTVFLKSERPSLNFYLGFIIAMTGICFISFGQASNIQINPFGDFLALFAAFIWSIYVILTKKISSFGINTIQFTRGTFFYGLIFMLPTLLFTKFNIDFSLIIKPVNLENILFLGFGASALCFVSWNFAVKVLGSVRTSLYIYMIPVITTISSVLILQEPIGLTSIVGIILTLLGLFLSETKTSPYKRPTTNV